MSVREDARTVLQGRLRGAYAHIENRNITYADIFKTAEGEIRRFVMSCKMIYNTIDVPKQAILHGRIGMTEAIYNCQQSTLDTVFTTNKRKQM